MSLRRYSKYKETCIPWIGQIPDHWAILKFRHSFRESKEKIEDVVVGEMLSVSGYRGIELKEYDDENRRRSEQDLIGYRIVRPGQLVVNTMWLNYAGLGVSGLEGHVSPAYRCYWIDDRYDKRFVHYLMRSAPFVQGYTSFVTGIRPNSLQMSRDDLMNFPVLQPPRDEQIAIASFLDYETKKIDALVAHQQRLIELLKEKRQALISRAVTKGLNTDVPVMESGIDYLGKVPRHWTVTPLGYRYGVQLGKMLDSSRITGNHLRPYLRVFDVQWGSINTDDLPQMDFDEEDRTKFWLEDGDLLVNEGGSYPGRSAIWTAPIEECYYQKALHRMRPFRPTEDSTQFLFYLMFWAANHGVFVAGGNETTIEHLPAEKLRKYRFAFPPFSEQVGISSFLKAEVTKLDCLSTEAARVIGLLQERRAALISAVVTGKVDVRQMAGVQTA